MTGLRIGHGYDVHAVCAGEHIVMGGVPIECGFALKAHSDGDVLAHAIIDAIFGACGLADIGAHFPDTDEAYRGADSMRLLSAAIGFCRSAGFEIVNIDATVIAQRPKMSPYIAGMRERIASCLGTAKDQVNVKATTEEHLGFTGRGEGIAAHAVCLMEKTPSPER